MNLQVLLGVLQSAFPRKDFASSGSTGRYANRQRSGKPHVCVLKASLNILIKLFPFCLGIWKSLTMSQRYAHAWGLKSMYQESSSGTAYIFNECFRREDERFRSHWIELNLWLEEVEVRYRWDTSREGRAEFASYIVPFWGVF